MPGLSSKGWKCQSNRTPPGAGRLRQRHQTYKRTRGRTMSETKSIFRRLGWRASCGLPVGDPAIVASLQSGLTRHRRGILMGGRLITGNTPCIEEMIAAIQAQLGLGVDRKAGPQTWGAIYARIVQKKIDGQPPAWPSPPWMRAAKGHRRTTAPGAAKKRARWCEAAARASPSASSAALAERDALYARGRTAPAPSSPGACPGGYSTTTSALPVDVGWRVRGQPLPVADSPKYKAVGVLGMDLGLGGAAAGRPSSDQPHFQKRPAWAAGPEQARHAGRMRTRRAAAARCLRRNRRSLAMANAHAPFHPIIYVRGYASDEREQDEIRPTLLRSFGGIHRGPRHGRRQNQPAEVCLQVPGAA